MPKYPGRIVSATPPSVSLSGASGVWTLEEVAQYEQAGTWPVGVSGADPNFKQTVLLLHGDGTNGAQNNTFLDSSSNNFTITRNPATGPNAPTQGTFSPFSVGAGEWSNYFDGTGDYLTVADNAALQMGASNFTIEGWFYPLNFTGNNKLIMIHRPAVTARGIVLGFNQTTGTPYILAGDSNNAAWEINITGSTSATLNAWNHVAFTRNSSTWNIWLNGVSVGSGTASFTMDDSGTAYLFSSDVGTDLFVGYISNFRIVKGTAVYTSAFTPSTTPLTAITNTSLLTCQSNRFVDNGVANSGTGFTITRNGDVRVTPFSPFAPTAAYSAGTNGGSGYFDGNGDYLSVARNTAFIPTTGDFTVEAWVYVSALQTSMLGGLQESGTAADWSLFLVNDGTITFFIGSSVQSYYSTATYRVGQWNHVMVCRSGSTLYLGVNGVANSTTATASLNNSRSYPFTIGADQDGDEGVFTGYISGWRFVNGSAVYPSTTYTVPTAPPTAITNTSLLLNFTNAGIFDQTGKNNLETVADAQIDTTTKKFGTGSLEFDGTGDYLNCRMNSELSLGSGNFTIEAWLYFTSVSGDKGIVSNFSTISGPPFQAFGINIRYASSLGGIRSVFGGGSLADAWTTSWSPSTNTWYHFAATRSGNSYRLFIDGTQIGSTETFTNATTIVNASDPSFSIGTAQTVASSDFQGFIDDLRITKGVARYTANFTPPTAAFLNQ